MNNFLDPHKPDFQKVIDHLKIELSALRTGRASPGLVEDIQVEAYDSMMSLKSLASITVSDARTLTIDPYDKNLAKAVEKAIASSPLGIMPTNDGKTIRVGIPQLTEERRKELLKIAQKKIEDGHVGVRNVREKIRNTIVESERAKKTSEDDRFRAQEQLEDFVKKQNEVIDGMGKEKEKEVMTV